MKTAAEWKKLLGLLTGFALCYAPPLEWDRFQTGLAEPLALTRWYAREHVILCLVSAFYLAVAIATFIRQEAVMRYLSPRSPKIRQGLLGGGMGKGPEVGLLLAGPALSLPNMLALAKILGVKKKMADYCVLVVVMSTLTIWL